MRAEVGPAVSSHLTIYRDVSKDSDRILRTLTTAHLDSLEAWHVVKSKQNLCIKLENICGTQLTYE